MSNIAYMGKAKPTNGGGSFTKEIITLTGTEGTLTSEQIATIKDNTKEYQIVCDGKIFYLSNTMTDLGYKTFINFDTALSTLSCQAIYINLSEEAVNYGRWTKEDVQLQQGE